MKTSNTDPFRMTKLVISFNRHFFAIALLAIVVGGILFFTIPYPPMQVAIACGIVTALYFVVGSVVVSYFVYDHSDLYKLHYWPERCFAHIPKEATLIHAGFDPASSILRRKYPETNLHVLDFFEPTETTEASIQLAHRLNAPTDPQENISSGSWPLETASQDGVFALSAAHEIRDEAKRAQFFKEAKRVLKDRGHVVVVEQLRDAANFLSFGLAAFHFLSRRTWLKSFADGGLIVEKEFSLSPWMRVFVLR